MTATLLAIAAALFNPAAAAPAPNAPTPDAPAAVSAAFVAPAAADSPAAAGAPADAGAADADATAEDAATATDALPPGDHARTVQVDGRKRSYELHIPPTDDPAQPLPVVLIFHGAGTNGRIMIPFCGMNPVADKRGFIAVYPNGTGTGIFLAFNAGGGLEKLTNRQPDDVKFTAAVLDDLAKVAKIDSKRVYATGMSNGGMMCYRLAAELTDRIAAIAPVAGTLAIDDPAPSRPVPLLHFHGTSDRVVPYNGPDERTPTFLKFKSVDESIQTWIRLNRCQTAPTIENLEDKSDDGTTVTRYAYPPGEGGAEVILFKIDGGGHTWPGQPALLSLIGRSTRDISANELIWDFFQRHRLP